MATRTRLRNRYEAQIAELTAERERLRTAHTEQIESLRFWGEAMADQISQQVLELGKMRRERDAARAAVERVQALADEWDRGEFCAICGVERGQSHARGDCDGMGQFVTDLRAALDGADHE